MTLPVSPGTRFDLHLHTNRSDGRFDQAEVLERCAAGGLHIVALTDHDLTSPLDPGLHTFGRREIRLLAGAELTGTHHGREQHLLVYFPSEVPEAFRELCARQVAERARRYDATIERLALPLTSASPEAHAGDHALTRLHLAHALVEGGHVSDTREAFARYLGAHQSAVPQLELDFSEAIRLARAHGGVTSWAHPQLEDAERYLPELVAAGLQGLEALRPTLNSRDRRRLKRLARTHGLFVTGGSDWHGWHRPEDLGLFAVHAHEIRGFLGALEAAA